MAFPVVESVTQSTAAAGSSSINASLPATVNSGDLLLLFVTHGTTSSSTLSGASGWTSLYDGSLNIRGGYRAWAKVAAGTEGGGSVTVNASTSGRLTAQVFRVTGWYGTLSGVETATSTSNSTSSADCPSLNPSGWGTEDTLWLAVAHAATFINGITGVPSGYSNEVNTEEAGGGTDSVTCTVRKQNAAASEDPGSFTGDNTSISWAVSTVAIRPAAGDTTPPTLTSATGTATGTTTADLSVSTNEANGTCYVVASESATAPTETQVKAGQDHTGSAAAFDGSQAISSTGTKSFSATGLSPGTTYYAHFMHEDAATNQSSVVTSSSFTTSAASSNYSYLQSAQDTSDLTTYTFSSQNLGSADSGRYIAVAIQSRRAGTGLAVSSVSVAGVSATIAIQQTNSSTNSNVAAIAIAAVPTGTSGDIVVTLNSAAVRCAISVYRLVGITGVTPTHTDTSTASDPAMTVDVPAGGYAIGSAITASSTTTTWTGLTENNDATLEGFATVTSAAQEYASAQTGLSVTADFGSTSESVGVVASWGQSAGSSVPPRKLTLLGVG